MGTTSVDPHALRFAAQRLDEAADLLDGAVRGHLNGLRLPPARSAVSLVVQDVAQWQRAARECACALRVSAQCYTDDDHLGAEALR